MTFIRHLLFAVTLVFAGAAFALDLDSAKSQGLVGEQPNGYLGVVKATSEAVELVSDVNEKRREAYQPGAGRQSGRPESDRENPIRRICEDPHRAVGDQIKGFPKQAPG